MPASPWSHRTPETEPTLLALMAQCSSPAWSPLSFWESSRVTPAGAGVRGSCPQAECTLLRGTTSSFSSNLCGHMGHSHCLALDQNNRSQTRDISPGLHLCCMLCQYSSFHSPLGPGSLLPREACCKHHTCATRSGSQGQLRMELG